MKNEIRIIHTADFQVKNRERNLARSYTLAAKGIEQSIRETQANVYLFAGDFFEYATPNDSEREIMYNHLARVASIDSIKEIILFVGNHDLIKEKKQLESNTFNNPIDTLYKFIKNLDADESKKFSYLKFSGQYVSKASPLLSWCAYSLEDGMQLKTETLVPNVFNICLYHDIVKEYVDEKKLPVKKDRYETLFSVSDFAYPLTLAGDIHENWTHQSITNDNVFVYSGSSIQRNHGEGSEIHVSNNKQHKHRVGANKVVKLVTLFTEDDNSTTTASHTIQDIELFDYIAYNDIVFDGSCLNNFEQILKDNLKFLKIGIEQTHIKVKLSNLFMKHEFEIYSIIQTHCSIYKRVSIEVTYDKFVDVDAAKNLKYEGTTAETINDDPNSLVLDEAKLSKLFDTTLDNIIATLSKEFDDDITIADIKQSIMSIFSDQLTATLNSSNKYNIILNYIENNNFMGLGSNRIQLDIPGLTRIVGTNGIGKTTLFSMLRWCVKDEVFQGMAKNKKIKNTLTIFNDKLIHVDNVITKLSANVNNTEIMVTRSAVRSWKASTTDEQKQSKSWKKYITGVEKNVKLDVFSEKNGNKSFTGEQAETLLNTWFGQTIDTIMILNQIGITQILNLPTNELKELVLNYIGVDYLSKLELNLDTVKNTLNLQKPKETKDQISEGIDSTSIDIKIFSKQCIEIGEKIFNKNEEENLCKNDLYVQQEKAIKIGDIPSIISNLQVEKEGIETKLNNFVTIEKKPLLINTEVSPAKPIIIEQELNITNIKKEISNLKLDIEAFECSYDPIQTICFNKLDEKIIEIEAEIKTLNIDEHKQKITDKYKILSDKFGSILLKLKDKETTKREDISVLKNKITNFKNSILDYEIELVSGVCEKCGKALSDDFEECKKTIEAKIVEIRDAMSISESELSKEKETLECIELYVLSYRRYYDLAIQHKFNDNLQYADGDAITINLEIKELDGALLILQKNEQDLKHKITVINIEREQIRSLHFQYVKNDRNIIVPNFQHEICVTSAKQFGIINASIVDAEKQILDKQSTVELVQQEIDLLNNQYTNKLENYQKHLEQIADANKQIELDNTRADTNNQIGSELNISLSNVNLEILKNSNKQEEYDNQVLVVNDLKSQLTKFGNEIDVLTKEESDLCLKLQNLEIKLKQFQEQYVNLLKYLKDKLIYDIYSKLIKREFKDIVFEYYRVYLNNTLNVLLEDMNFKLFWDNENDLYMIDLKNGACAYRPVQQTSGMETCFLGLSLIYTIHTLNIRNTISNIFIDEISGQLNNGKGLTYTNEEDIHNYQEQLLFLLSKFTTKNIFIIDHVIENMFETCTLEVRPTKEGSKYIVVS